MAAQIGDAMFDQEYSDDDPETVTSHQNDLGDQYPYSYPMLMEQQIRKLKLSLENWKEIILPIKSVFVWEKQWHPTAIIGASTITFTLLWLIEPSILTVFSMIGLFFTICDYLLPSLSSTLFKSEIWTNQNDRDFGDFCTNLILYKAKLELTWASYYRMRLTNKRSYFILTIAILSLLAWMGCTFNNLFLAYIMVSFLLLFPGMEHNGMISKWTESLQNVFGEFVKQAASRMTPSERKED